MNKEQMTALIAALEAERDEVVAQANRQIAYLNGKIDLLHEWILAADKPAEVEVESA